MKKTTLILFAYLIASGGAIAQDPVFAQPYANPLYLNPAYAGTGTSQRIGLNFRDQWPAIPGNFYDYSISYDRNIIDSSLGIGVLGTQDRAGHSSMVTTNVSLLLAYQFHIKAFTLSVGAQGGYLQKNINQNQLEFGSMIDPRRGFVYSAPEVLSRTNATAADFSAGVLGYGKNYFAGFAIDHFTQPNESFAGGTSPLPIKYVANAGVMIHIGSFTISPTMMYQYQSYLNELIGECYFSWKYFTIGVGCDFNAATIFTAGFKNKFLSVGYSFDYYPNIPFVTGGMNEASLAIFLPYKSAKLKKINGINCPGF